MNPIVGSILGMLASTPGHPLPAPLAAMPESLEVRWALSALPPQLREQANVYVLDPAKGYRLYRAGTNGQHCYVQRTEWQFADYDHSVFFPICYGAGAAKSQLKLEFDVAAMRARGVSAQAVRTEVERRLKAGVYVPPRRPGVSYMAAPVMRAHVSQDTANKTVMTMYLPHVMYLAPNVTDPQVGGMTPPPPSPYPFVLNGGPMGMFVQLMGVNEAKEVVTREADLVQALCGWNTDLCVSRGPTMQ